MKSIGKKVAFFIALLLLWYGVAHSGLWPKYMIPPPESVFENLISGIKNGVYIKGLLISIKRILIGYGISVTLGIPLGLLTGKIRWLDETVGSFMLGLQTLPSICWLPLAILWFGLNEKAIIFVVLMGAVLSIALATDSGVKHIPPIYLRAGKNLGAQGFNLFSQVILPAALPSIVAGLKQGWSFAWRSLMAGELIFVSLGMGHLLMMGRELNDMSQVIGVMLILIGTGLFFDRLVFFRLEQGIRRRWGLERS
jgi:NitT/TauT family transport system permease protein